MFWHPVILTEFFAVEIFKKNAAIRQYTRDTRNERYNGLRINFPHQHFYTIKTAANLYQKISSATEDWSSWETEDLPSSLTEKQVSCLDDSS